MSKTIAETNNTNTTGAAVAASTSATSAISTAIAAPATVVVSYNPGFDEMTDETFKTIVQSKNEKETMALLLALSEEQVRKYMTEKFTMLTPDVSSEDFIYRCFRSDQITLLEHFLLHQNVAVICCAIRKFQRELSQIENRDYLHQILTDAVHQDENFEAVKLLLDCNADLGTPTKYTSDTIFTQAVISGSTQIVEFLLSRTTLPIDTLPIDALRADLKTLGRKFSLDVTGLGRAAQRGHAQVVELLLHRKASIDLCYTHYELVREVEGNTGVTALMAAAYKGHLEIVRTLLKHKADVEQPNLSGETALMHVMRTDNTVVEAFATSNKAIADFHNRLQIIQLLLQANANINKVSQPIDRTALLFLFSLSPLTYAFDFEFEEACHLLINRNASVHQIDSRGNSTLLQFCKGGGSTVGSRKIELLRLLLDNGVNIHIQSNIDPYDIRETRGTALDALIRFHDSLNSNTTNNSASTSNSSSAAPGVVGTGAGAGASASACASTSIDVSRMNSYATGATIAASTSSISTCAEAAAECTMVEIGKKAKEETEFEENSACINLLKAEHDIQAAGLNPLELQRQLIAAFNAPHKHEIAYGHERQALINLIPTLVPPQLLRDNPTLLAKLELRLIDSVMPHILAIRTYENLSHDRTDCGFINPLPIIFSYVSCRNYSLTGPSVLAPATAATAGAGAAAGATTTTTTATSAANTAGAAAGASGTTTATAATAASAASAAPGPVGSRCG